MEGRERVPHQLVLCEWIDSSEPMDNAELTVDELPEPQLIYQVGLLVMDTPAYIVIAGAWKPEAAGEQDSYDYAISIPRSAIQRLEII
tara:strand:- start:35 stop:298 length:264 start_codon:yes stop_codon:yes gene_type:complete